MTKGTAEEYWSSTAEGQFESMTSTYEPGERGSGAVKPDAKPARRSLPPLTASQTIVDAIAACAPPRDTPEPVEQPAVAPADAVLTTG